MQNRLALALASLGLLALSNTANAEKIYGITDNGSGFGVSLISFDSATPAVQTTIGALTGIVGTQLVRAIDFRPADGKLYAVSNLGTAAQLYTVNLNTAALTPVGSGFTFASNPATRISIDFNPVVDRLRVISGVGNNLRINPITGALANTDTNLTFDGPSVGVTGTPLIADIAYSNNVVGATQTTLYAYDYDFDFIGTIGGINGTPSPNGGVVFDSIPSPNGVGFTSNTASIGFDISGATGVGYVNADGADATTNDRLYTINFSNGAANLVGTFGRNILDISVAPGVAVPEPGTIAMLVGLGVSGVALRRRRK